MSQVLCPKCGSDQLSANKKGFSGKKAVTGAILTGGIGLLAGTIGSNNIKINCLSCGNEFLPGQGATSLRDFKKKKRSGCFVATACYGNYEAPEVLILRQYRDQKLLKTFYGTAFVEFYYFISPFLVLLIGKSDILKKSIKKYFLEPIITRLKK